eukprot:TRINITY_DN25445_c0_g1_i12.p1 TRINITY_DN25445_c0_g1~~TRINITY_DN25445_c0_g1_i12.p1  ORF type:complete len:143 (-),score=25.82 TRINITY_DN25445_c0_g1_i12:132-560(-)
MCLTDEEDHRTISLAQLRIAAHVLEVEQSSTRENGWTQQAYRREDPVEIGSVQARCTLVLGEKGRDEYVSASRWSAMVSGMEPEDVEWLWEISRAITGYRKHANTEIELVVDALDVSRSGSIRTRDLKQLLWSVQDLSLIHI